MSIYCSFTAVWDVWTAASCSQRGPCFPEALLSWIQLSSLTRRRSRTDIDSETLCRETQQIDQTAFFCPPCCRDAGLLAGEASRMWKQHITITTKLFFTLYILSIFTQCIWWGCTLFSFLQTASIKHYVNLLWRRWLFLSCGSIPVIF